MMKLRLPVLLAALLLCAAAHSPTAPAKRPGKDVALFFATDTYQTATWRKLSAPVRDAREIAADLYDLYGFDTTVVVNPTKNQVRDKLAEYAGRTDLADGQLLVFFSGHGHYIDLAKDGFYIPHDGKASRDDRYGDSWLKYTDLRRTISGINCPHILLVMDACFSGTLDADVVYGIMGDEDEDRPGEAEAARTRRIEDMLRPRTRLFISSGQKDYVPDPSEFALRFKEGLRSLGGADGLLDVHALYHGHLKAARSQPLLRSFEQDQTSSTFIFDYRSRRAKAPASADTDGDGTPNDRDRCPDQYGPPENQGCPLLEPGGGLADTDGDGTPDSRDACPEAYGTAKANGCPDADDDGVPDLSDKCRYQAGQARWEGCPDSDDDGLPDHLDLCPKEAGLPADKGCPPPDRDGDGVPDRADRCPDQAGKTNLQGCPDTDGDGIPDPDDKCPGEKGPPGNNGCPEKTDFRPDYFARITGGTFSMGDQFGDGESDEKPVHTVELSDFYLGKTEVTFEEYDAFCTATGRTKPGDKGWGRGKRPVINVSWLDAVAYCNWLSEKQGLRAVYTISGDNVTADWRANGYRLPTEAEWEYAARGGGKKEKWAGTSESSSLTRYANINGTADGHEYTAPVGSLQPNSLGLYDMSGNVWEWCWDWYGSDYYGGSARKDPRGPGTGGNRVLRGGSWGGGPANVRVADRSYLGPSRRSNHGVGFRLARTALAGGG